jgi:TolB-like protein/Tfp pilus assembly protein PilF/tRNA A-37 threonylcarbamoyl transferase component Bud32
MQAILKRLMPEARIGVKCMVPPSHDGGLDDTRWFKTISPGTVISHYEILERIGAGGMAVVYKARDARLERLVALKLLAPALIRDEEAKERFVREARAASALDHPNICTVHEIDETEDGQMFISMSYYEGGTLKDMIREKPLTSLRAIEIAVQVARGLAEAHEKGVIHRDIKPANIMMTAKGQVKIMDFGLAKLSGEEGITEIGIPMGTVAYMSPEQAEGRDIDCRTDIWSLGVVLYEMVSGRPPFKGENAHAILYSILNVDPVPVTRIRPGIENPLERIINKALTKDPDSRYQSVGDLLADLREIGYGLETRDLKTRPSSAEAKASIAVLPFVDMSPEKDQEYFCDGMAEELIGALTKIEEGGEQGINEIGERLRVRAVLEGSVRKAGDRLRITAQLVNVHDGYQLWSEKYDRDIADVFAIQDEISLAIVEKLRINLLGGEKAALVKRHTDDLEAYNLYLRGRYFWNKRTAGGVEKAIASFKQAIDKDPGYALAYAGLADAYITLPDYAHMPPAEALITAKKAALRALEIDEMLAEAHASLGFAVHELEWDWVAAERHLERALEINPRYATAHHWYALFLMRMGRFGEAIKEMEKAVELDPLSLVLNRNLGAVLYYARDYDRAIEVLRKTLEMDPGFSFAHVYLGQTYLQKSMYDEALAELETERAVAREWMAEVETFLGTAYARAGFTDKAREILDDLLERSKRIYVSPCLLALMCLVLNEKDRAFEFLEKAYRSHDIDLTYLKIDPRLDTVRSDPRYMALLKRIGLADR